MEVPHDRSLRDVVNARENNDHMMSAPLTVEMFGEKINTQTSSSSVF